MVVEFEAASGLGLALGSRMGSGPVSPLVLAKKLPKRWWRLWEWEWGLALVPASASER